MHSPSYPLRYTVPPELFVKRSGQDFARERKLSEGLPGAGGMDEKILLRPSKEM